MSGTSSSATEPAAQGAPSFGRRFWRLQRIFDIRSIRFRLVAIFVAIFGTTLIVFSTLLYRTFSESHQQNFDNALFNYAIDVSQAVVVDLFGGRVAIRLDSATDAKQLPFNFRSTFVQIRSLDGRVVYKSKNLAQAQLPLDPNDLRVAFLEGVAYRTVPAVELPSAQNQDTSSHRMIIYMLRPRGFILQISVPTSYLDRDRRSILGFFFLNVPLTLVVAMFGGLFLSRRAIAPVGAIIDRAQRITPSRLSDRVPVPAVKDEIQALALTINGLLDRLEKAFTGQERFISDASHQLRTPLSILRGEIDVFRSRERTKEETDEFFESARQEIDHLSRMVQDLLVLAKVDAGQAVLTFQRVRLDEQLIEIVSRLQKFADRSRVRLSLSVNLDEGSDPEILGDPELLQVLLQNLIENAIKYSPTDAPVRITLSADERYFSVAVEDQGEGVPPDALEKIFERFHRVTSSKGPTGAGLGLAISRKIADAHRGTVTAENRLAGGARFLLRLPKIPTVIASVD